MKECTNNNNLLETTELAEQLKAAKASLPPARKRIFEQMYEEGKSLKTIALELGIGIQTAKNQVYKAVKMLRSSLVVALD